MATNFTFIGFGEAAQHLSRGLKTGRCRHAADL